MRGDEGAKFGGSDLKEKKRGGIHLTICIAVDDFLVRFLLMPFSFLFL